MICSVFSAFHVGHHHDHLADMMANMKRRKTTKADNFPLKGERIPAQGKLVFERRPGSPVKNMDLPCKGNGISNTQFPYDFLI